MVRSNSTTDAKLPAAWEEKTSGFFRFYTKIEKSLVALRCTFSAKKQTKLRLLLLKLLHEHVKVSCTDS